MPEQQKEPAFRVICMDCKVVTQEGDPGAAISHGLCDRCYKLRMAELVELGYIMPDSKEGAA
jgi:hypothetical protein